MVKYITFFHRKHNKRYAIVVGGLDREYVDEIFFMIKNDCCCKKIYLNYSPRLKGSIEKISPEAFSEL